MTTLNHPTRHSTDAARDGDLTMPRWGAFAALVGLAVGYLLLAWGLFTIVEALA